MLLLLAGMGFRTWLCFWRERSEEQLTWWPRPLHKPRPQSAWFVVLDQPPLVPLLAGKQFWFWLLLAQWVKVSLPPLPHLRFTLPRSSSSL